MNTQEPASLRPSMSPEVSQRVQSMRDMLTTKRTQAHTNWEAKDVTGPQADISHDPVERAVASFRNSLQSPDPAAAHKDVITPEHLANAVQHLASQYKPVAPASHEAVNSAQPSIVPRTVTKTREIA